MQRARGLQLTCKAASSGMLLTSPSICSVGILSSRSQCEWSHGRKQGVHYWKSSSELDSMAASTLRTRLRGRKLQSHTAIIDGRLDPATSCQPALNGFG
jgi:hypothetical protein